MRYLILSLCLGCASSQTAEPQPALASEVAATPADAAPPPCPTTPGLCFNVEPADAEIVLETGPAGTVASLGQPAFLKLESGIYQITLRRAGYATWRAEVSVQSAAERIDVKLEPK